MVRRAVEVHGVRFRPVSAARGGQRAGHRLAARLVPQDGRGVQAVALRGEGRRAVSVELEAVRGLGALATLRGESHVREAIVV